MFRIVMLSCLALASSGCAGAYEFLVPAQKRYQQEKSAVDVAMKDAREKQDCELAVNTLNGAKNRDRVRTSLDDQLTPYGEEVKAWWQRCVLEGATLVASKDAKGTEVERLERALHLYELALSLPVEKLRLEDKHRGSERTLETITESSVARITEGRAKLAAALTAAKQALADNQADTRRKLELAARAEAKGWLLAAVFAWQSTSPLEPEVRKQKAAELARLAPLARAQAAVDVALAPAPTDGVSPQVLAAIAEEPGLKANADLRLVTDASKAAVVVRLSQGKAQASKDEEAVAMQHTWVSGRKTVPNPQLERLQKDIAYHDKEAAYWRRKITEIRCTGSGPCKSRISAQDNVRREEEHAARYRKDLAKEKPTVVKEQTAVHEYSAKKLTWNLSSNLSATLVVGGEAGAPVEGVAKVQRSTMAWAAAPQVGLAARNDAAPTPAELEAALRTEAVRLLAGALARAPAAAAAQFDAQLAAATDPLEKLQYALVKATRSKQKPDAAAVRALAREVFGGAAPATEEASR